MINSQLLRKAQNLPIPDAGNIVYTGYTQGWTWLSEDSLIPLGHLTFTRNSEAATVWWSQALDQYGMHRANRYGVTEVDTTFRLSKIGQYFE